MADGSLDYLDPDLAAQEQQLARRRATAQMLLQQGMGDPGNQQYGGLRSAGSAILGAVLSRRADAQELSLAKQRAAMLGNLLNDNSSPSSPSPAQVANIPSAPMSQSDMEESQIPGGSPALISPQVSNTPTAPPQAAPKSKAQKLAEFLSILKGDPKGILEAESYQTPQAKSDLERQQAIAIAQGSRPTPEYLGQQAGAEAAGRLPSEIALKGAPSAPTPGMTPEALLQQEQLKQTPSAPAPPESPEAFKQKMQLATAGREMAPGANQVLQDKDGTPYTYNVITHQAQTLDGKPYNPTTASKIASGTARSALAMGVQRFLQENPNATSDDIARYNAQYNKTIAQVGGETKADVSSLTNIQKLGTQASAQEQAMTGALNMAQGLMQKGAGTSLGPVVNRWIQAGRQATGDPDVAAFNTAMQTAANEYAKIITGSSGATDASRAEASSMINKFQSPEAILAQIAVVQKDAHFKIQSYQDHAQFIRDKLSGSGPAATPAPSAPLAPGAKRLRYDDQGNPIP